MQNLATGIPTVSGVFCWLLILVYTDDETTGPLKTLHTLIKNKIQFSSYIWTFRVEQFQSHIWGRASYDMRICANISPYMRRPLVIYDFATAPFWICLLFYQCTQQHSGTYSLASISWYMLGEILPLKMKKPWSILLVLFGSANEKEQILHMSTSHRANQWGRRLQGWSNTAARLAGWRRVPPSRCDFFLDGPCRLPWRTTPLAPVWGWSITLLVGG